MKPVIVYEDRDIIVCEKEAGVPVQSAGIGTKDMVSILKNYRSESEYIKGEPYIGVIHRLDQPVQGLLVFAKTKEAAAALSAQAAGDAMQKKYLAVACGDAMGAEGELHDYLLKDGRTNSSRVVKKETKGAKEARLVYRILNKKEGLMLAEIRLYTGRHHQIRVQMANAGMPLYGDQKYGNPGSVVEETSGDGRYVKGSGQSMLALCAYKLSFNHPVTGKVMEFTCTPKGSIFSQMSE